MFNLRSLFRQVMSDLFMTTLGAPLQTTPSTQRVRQNTGAQASHRKWKKRRKAGFAK